MQNNRRTFLKGSAAALTGAICATKAPYVFAKKTVTLRVMGTHVTLQEPLRRRAMQELGIDIRFEPMGSAAVLQKASADPASFDLYEQWSDSINVLWYAGAIQALDVDRLTYWPEISDLTKTGKIRPDAQTGAGDAPNKILFVQNDGLLGAKPTKQISFMPYVHNVDSFGYDTRVIAEAQGYTEESWGWLLDDANRGKVGLVNAPTIGIFDAALAAQAQGLVRFNDIGNMTIAELDQLFAVLIEKKQSGHFAGFWTSVPQSVEFMVNRRVNIQSMFSPVLPSQLMGALSLLYTIPFPSGPRNWGQFSLIFSISIPDFIEILSRPVPIIFSEKRPASKARIKTVIAP